MFKVGCLGLCLTIAAELARAERLEERRPALAAFMQDALETGSAPGATAGIIKDGEVLLAEGFGYIDLETKHPVTQDTVFAIGSSTKAFTTASVALLIDDGRLAWDQPVIAYLPWFRMVDQHATLHAIPRDFALHRSGLARHDFSWYGRVMERDEVLASIERLEPAVDHSAPTGAIGVDAAGSAADSFDSPTQ